MPLGQLLAICIQTLFLFAFVMLLLPFRVSRKTTLAVVGGLAAVLLGIALCLSAQFGTLYLMQYGFYFLGIPLFLALYLLSKARGVRFLFVAITAMICHQILATLLMVFRIHVGGFTFLYFLLNVLAFGALLTGAYVLRKDFHKIIFSYQYEFACLDAILLFLFVLSRLSSPVAIPNVVDSDLMFLTVAMDLLTVLLYLYVGFSFRSLGKMLDSERDALTLRLQVEEAQNHVTLLRFGQERAAYYRHDLRHHLFLIRAFLENDELEKLHQYLDEVQSDIEGTTPERYCQNEAVNLLLVAFMSKAKIANVRLCIDTQIPHSLPISNPELCALISNALENAIQAAQAETCESEREVRLMVRQTDGKLLVLVENPYQGEVILENGLPQSTSQGHGFGTRSMQTIAEKYGGLTSFSAKGGIFTARIVL